MLSNGNGVDILYANSGAHPIIRYEQISEQIRTLDMNFFINRKQK